MALASRVQLGISALGRIHLRNVNRACTLQEVPRLVRLARPERMLRIMNRPRACLSNAATLGRAPTITAVTYSKMHAERENIAPAVPRLAWIALQVALALPMPLALPCSALPEVTLTRQELPLARNVPPEPTSTSLELHLAVHAAPVASTPPPAKPTANSVLAWV